MEDLKEDMRRARKNLLYITFICWFFKLFVDGIDSEGNSLVGIKFILKNIDYLGIVLGVVFFYYLWKFTTFRHYQEVEINSSIDETTRLRWAEFWIDRILKAEYLGQNNQYRIQHGSTNQLKPSTYSKGHFLEQKKVAKQKAELIRPYKKLNLSTRYHGIGNVFVPDVYSGDEIDPELLVLIALSEGEYDDAFDKINSRSLLYSLFYHPAMAEILAPYFFALSVIIYIIILFFGEQFFS